MNRQELMEHFGALALFGADYDSVPVGKDKWRERFSAIRNRYSDFQRLAIECDGAAYHDAKKDALRDAELRRMGWHVVRIPGRDCWTDECAEIIRSLA